MLTSAVITSFNDIGWHATAGQNMRALLPVARGEYLSLDVVAFAQAENKWQFPAAVVELENSKDDDKVAYSLWKVLCIRDALRIVFCYRAEGDDGNRLVRHLRDNVVKSIELELRTKLFGETILIVGQKGVAETFPYSYFKWWRLNTNTSNFETL
jgi:hypothetical protein